MRLTKGEGETVTNGRLKDVLGEDGSAEEVEMEEEGSEGNEKEEEEEEEEGEEREHRESSDESSREGVSLFTGQSPLQSGAQAKVARRRRKKKNRSLEKSSATAQMDLQRQEVSTDYIRNVCMGTAYCVAFHMVYLKMLHS